MQTDCTAGARRPSSLTALLRLARLLLGVAIAWPAGMALAAETVQVTDLYMPYQVVGYSIGRNANHKLSIDVAVDFGTDIQTRLPITLRAELVVGRRAAVARFERELPDMTEATKLGDLEADGRRWKFDDLFSWDFFCDGKGRTIRASGKDGPVSLGDEEVELLIRVGALSEPDPTKKNASETTRSFVPDSVYQTPKRIRLVCGDLTPLPR